MQHTNRKGNEILQSAKEWKATKCTARQRDRERKRDIEREKEKEAAGSNNSWLLAVACWLAGWLCWLGWQHPLAKISFCVKSLKWASAWLGLEQCREPKGELRVESWELVLCCEICECCKCQGKTAAARRSPKKDQEEVEEAAAAAVAAEVGKTRWVRVETRTRTKFDADVVKNWQQMLLNFKRNFTYLSCGAHSLRCSFERSFRQPTSCCSPLPPPFLSLLLQLQRWANLPPAMLGGFIKATFFAPPPQLGVSAYSSAAASSLHWPYLIIHQNFVGWCGGKSLSSAFDVNLRSHSGLFTSLPLSASVSVAAQLNIRAGHLYASFPAADFHLTCSFRFRFNDALIGLAVCAWRSTPLTVSPLSFILPCFPFSHSRSHKWTLL